MHVVFNGYDNPIKLKLSERVLNGIEPLDLSGASSVSLILPDLSTTISSGITFNAGNGIIEMSLGGEAIPKGVHRARLVVVDPLHPNGQVLLHETVNDFRVRVI